MQARDGAAPAAAYEQIVRADGPARGLRVDDTSTGWGVVSPAVDEERECQWARAPTAGQQQRMFRILKAADGEQLDLIGLSTVEGEMTPA